MSLEMGFAIMQKGEPVSDLISRQAILKHIEKIRQGAQMMDDIRRASIIMNGMYLCEKAVRNQPSAQPEIIRCKDCRWGRETCGNIECFVDLNVPPEYHGYEWFCPNGERRTDEID